jgi:undecaprenyl phosphate-alpha-L-ara4N flippase subunit ArnE
MTLKGAILILLTISFTVTGQILMKKGMPTTGNLDIRNIFSSPVLLAGALCYVIGFFSWLQVLNILPLSIAYPSSSASFIIVIFASAIFLGEPLNAFKLFGALFIFGGVFLISQG